MKKKKPKKKRKHTVILELKEVEVYRILTQAERCVFGKCPVCGAGPGEKCKLGDGYKVPKRPFAHVARFRKSFEAMILSQYDDGEISLAE